MLVFPMVAELCRRDGGFACQEVQNGVVFREKHGFGEMIAKRRHCKAEESSSLR